MQCRGISGLHVRNQATEHNRAVALRMEGSVRCHSPQLSSALLYGCSSDPHVRRMNLKLTIGLVLRMQKPCNGAMFFKGFFSLQ